MTNDTKEAFSALGVSCGERIQHGIRRALSHAARWGCKSDWRSGRSVKPQNMWLFLACGAMQRGLHGCRQMVVTN